MCADAVEALFNFLAELCWANYICPSEHAIQKAMHCLLESAVALSERTSSSEPAGWYLHAAKNFQSFWACKLFERFRALLQLL